MGSVFWCRCSRPAKPNAFRRPQDCLSLTRLHCLQRARIILTFAPISICPVYQHPVDRLGMLSTIRGDWGLTSDRDQQIGGLLMWVPMCAIYATAFSPS